MVIKWVPASPEELARRVSRPIRAREDNGTFRADDPETPDVNEAWVAPPKRRTRKPKE